MGDVPATGRMPPRVASGFAEPDNVSVFITALARDPRRPLPPREHLAQRLMNIFPDGHRMLQPTLQDPITGLTINAWLRLDNSDELTAELGEPATPLRVVPTDWHFPGPEFAWDKSGSGTVATGATFPDYEDKEPDPRFARDAALVVAAYRKWGPDCASHLEGDFSIVILDPRDSSAFATRDAVGIRPLYVAITDEVFAASSSAAAFDLFPGVDISVRWEWLADFIHDMSGDWRDTPFVGVKRLPPGHWLHVQSGEVTERRYHEFDAESPWEDSRDPRWLEAYRNELIRAVSERMEPHGLIGVESSGGLDSSSVLGVMAHSQPERVNDIHTFGFAYHNDEPGYILETSSAHGISSNHIFTGVDPLSRDQARGWRTLGYPSEHGNAVVHMPFYLLASQLGVQSLHSGHGGDEAVTNAASHALQELTDRRRWGQLLLDLPGPAILRPLRLVKQLQTRSAQTSQQVAPMMARLDATPLRNEVLIAGRIRERAIERAQFDAPHRRVNDFVLRARLSPITSIRTADCSLVAASFGVDYRWPLLDTRLIQQYLHTPTIWKYGEGYGRYIHRCAVAGMVPRGVAWKQGKYMGAQRKASLRQRSALMEITRHERTRAPGPGGRNPMESLNWQIRDLVDSTRLWNTQASPGTSSTETQFTKVRYLTNLLLLSDWLNDGVYSDSCRPPRYRAET